MQITQFGVSGGLPIFALSPIILSFNIKIAICKFKLLYCKKEEMRTFLCISVLGLGFFLMTNTLQKNCILDRSRKTDTFTAQTQGPFWNGQY